MKTKIIAEIAIFSALGVIIDYLCGLFFRFMPMGGSLNLTCLVIFVISYRRGLKSGLLCGLMISVTQIITNSLYVVTTDFENHLLKILIPFLQILFDYILPYTLVGFAGLFYKKYQNSSQRKGCVTALVIGAVIGGLLKYASHTVSGIFFWPGEIFGISGPLYSFIYNGIYQIPNIIICVSLLIMIELLNKKILKPNN